MKSGLQHSGFWDEGVPLGVVLTYPGAVDVCGDGVNINEGASGGDK